MLHKGISLETIDKVISLRKNYVTLDSISRKVGLSSYYVEKILRNELGGEYLKYYQNERIFAQENVKKIVELRKQRKKLEQISESVRISIPVIKRILKRELKEDYYFYTCRVRYLPENIIKEIIRLRTEKGHSINEISTHFGISYTLVRKLLKRKLKRNYKKYCNRMTSYHRALIFKFANKGLSHIQISTKVKVPIATIRRLLERTFYQLFDEVTSEAPFNEYKELKEEGYRFMQDIREKIKKGAYLRNESKLSPIVLFLLFKMKRINFTLEHYLRLSKITRGEFRKRLKYVLPYYPEYQIRDKKALVIEGISNLQNKFNFSTRFFNTSMVLLDRFWHHISNTKEEVITGVLSILTMIKLNVNSVQHNIICNFLGIRSSSVHYHLKHSIGIAGFQGFKKSVHIVKAML